MEDYSSNSRITDLQPTSLADDRTSLSEAIDFLANRLFSSVPATWIAEILDSRGLPTAMPMYSTLFMANDEWLTESLRRRVVNFDFAEDVDRQRLIESGWQVIPRTGFFAFELDSRLLLGVDGTGYDFFEAHWRPLYEVLGLELHLDD